MNYQGVSHNFNRELFPIILILMPFTQEILNSHNVGYDTCWRGTYFKWWILNKSVL